MNRRTLSAAALCCLALAACSSGSGRKPDPALGTRTLDCLVVGREQDSGGSSASSYSRSTGNYYLVFETKEGQATARYRLEVTRQQYMRFEDGDRVKITLNNNMLTDIRPND
jgi:hypothetical protein